MKLIRSKAIAMFQSLAEPYPMATKWSEERLLKRLGNFEEIVGDVEAVKGDGNRELAKAVLATLKDGNKFELIAETETKGEPEMTTANKTRKVKAKETTTANKTKVKAKETTTANKTKVKARAIRKIKKNGRKDWSPREGSITETILKCLRDGPVTKDFIVSKLKQKFPSHKGDSLTDTVSWMISSAKGLHKRGIRISKTDEGYSCAN